MTECQQFNVLAYHVTKGKRFSSSVIDDEDPKRIRMVNGESIMSMPDLTLVDTNEMDFGLPMAMIDPALFDVPAKNGVLHSIDQVLLPESVLDDCGDDTED